MNIGNLQNFYSETDGDEERESDGDEERESDGDEERESDGDEEWEGNELVFEGECDQCHVTRPCVLAVDPYIEEVYPDEYENLESEGWCKSCYVARKMNDETEINKCYIPLNHPSVANLEGLE